MKRLLSLLACICTASAVLQTPYLYEDLNDIYQSGNTRSNANGGDVVYNVIDFPTTAGLDKTGSEVGVLQCDTTSSPSKHFEIWLPTLTFDEFSVEVVAKMEALDTVFPGYLIGLKDDSGNGDNTHGNAITFNAISGKTSPAANKFFPVNTNAAPNNGWDADSSYWTSVSTTTRLVEVDTWYHIIVSQDAAGVVRVFVNGVLYGSSYSAPGGVKSPSSSTLTLYLCGDASAGTVGIDAQIRAFGFYQVAITSDADATDSCDARAMTDCNGMLASTTEFIFVPDFMTFADAQTHCQTQFNGELASIHSSAENDQVTALCENLGQLQAACWLGMSNAVAPTSWLDGTPIDFTSWYGVEPDAAGIQPCIVTKGGLWFSVVYCTTPVPFVCLGETAAPTTAAPTTDAPTTDAPTTALPTAVPTTAAPTTAAPTTAAPTTAAPTTAAPTSTAPTTTHSTGQHQDPTMQLLSSKQPLTTLMGGTIYAEETQPTQLPQSRPDVAVVVASSAGALCFVCSSVLIYYYGYMRRRRSKLQQVENGIQQLQQHQPLPEQQGEERAQDVGIIQKIEAPAAAIISVHEEPASQQEAQDVDAAQEIEMLVSQQEVQDVDGADADAQDDEPELPDEKMDYDD
eukprot:CAMPEP_0202726404 /NCGR_PEP_ID=MMETSP1385-20130828/184595_1 /ASSEMBLY_ACC=CAM_ASM_000861 /TAXON_ID=933848 /ORGANISM="Elphidium margaritaceum" /LENGTH=626 /DNA_ID=CAMNT_0049392625 /DNA_START=104 /DNA_END=1981 /DNA_ORIENTATION=+